MPKIKKRTKRGGAGGYPHPFANPQHPEHYKWLGPTAEQQPSYRDKRTEILEGEHALNVWERHERYKNMLQHQFPNGLPKGHNFENPWAEKVIATKHKIPVEKYKAPPRGDFRIEVWDTPMIESNPWGRTTRATKRKWAEPRGKKRPREYIYMNGNANKPKLT